MHTYPKCDASNGIIFVSIMGKYDYLDWMEFVHLEFLVFVENNGLWFYIPRGCHSKNWSLVTTLAQSNKYFDLKLKFHELGFEWIVLL